MYKIGWFFKKYVFSNVRPELKIFQVWGQIKTFALKKNITFIFYMFIISNTEV